MKKGFTLVEVMIIFVIIGLVAAMAIPAIQKVRTSLKEKERAEANNDPEFTTYAAWIKLTKRYDITLEEWKRLKNAGLLTSVTPQ